MPCHEESGKDRVVSKSREQIPAFWSLYASGEDKTLKEP